jgi:hypothetical protein
MQREPPLDNQSLRWSETSDVIPIFATLVWKVELEAQLRGAICARALAALARMRRDLPPLAPGEGWQSVQSLHGLDDSGISSLACTASCREFCDSSGSATTRTKSPPVGRVDAGIACGSQAQDLTGDT